MGLIESFRNKRAEHQPSNSWTLEQTAENLQLLQDGIIDLGAVIKSGYLPSHFHHFFGADEPAELSVKIKDLYDSCADKDNFRFDKSPEAITATELYYDYFKQEGFDTFAVLAGNPQEDSQEPGQVVVANYVYEGADPMVDKIAKLFPFADYQIEIGFKTNDIDRADSYFTINTTREEGSLYKADISGRTPILDRLKKQEEELRERHILLERNPKKYWSTFVIAEPSQKLISNMLAAKR